MNRFFFAPDNPRRLALVRIAVGLVLLIDALSHWRYAIELYSQFLPVVAVFPLAQLPLPVPPPALAVLLDSALVFFLAAATLGWKTRTSLVSALVLSLGLGLLDHAGTFAKYSVLGLHFLFLLACSTCSGVWAIDAAGRGDSAAPPSGPAWPRRLMQLLICSVYLGAALTKIKSPWFANGDLLMFSLLDDHWGGGAWGQWLSAQRHLPMLLSLATILYETLFPFLIWVDRCRRPLLAAAVCLHLGMWCAMHLGIFTPLMISALLVFVEDADFDATAVVISRLRARLNSRRTPAAPRGQSLRAAPTHSWHRWRSWGAYLAAVTLVAGTGLAIQYFDDAYGAFGRRAPLPLAELPAREVTAALALSKLKPPPEDSVHRVELGSRVSGNQVFGSPARFHRGQRVYVLVQATPRHEPLTLEGLLIDPDGDEAARFDQRLDSADSYSVHGFQLTDRAELGAYQMKLLANGREVTHRRFEVVP